MTPLNAAAAPARRIAIFGAIAVLLGGALTVALETANPGAAHAACGGFSRVTSGKYKNWVEFNNCTNLGEYIIYEADAEDIRAYVPPMKYILSEDPNTVLVTISSTCNGHTGGC